MCHGKEYAKVDGRGVGQFCDGEVKLASEILCTGQQFLVNLQHEVTPFRDSESVGECTTVSGLLSGWPTLTHFQTVSLQMRCHLLSRFVRRGGQHGSQFHR